MRTNSEICLDLVGAATAMVDQVVSETREFHEPPESIGTELMRHIHSLSWENDTKGVMASTASKKR